MSSLTQAAQLRDKLRLYLCPSATNCLGDRLGRLRYPIAELIRLFLQGLDDRFRAQLIDQLCLVFSAYERDDLAARLDAHQRHLLPRGGQATT